MKHLVAAGLVLAAAGDPAFAAEQISFQLGELERSIPIEQLASFAAGDPPGAELADALRLLKPSQRQSLRLVLNQSAPVNGVMASNYLGTAIGKRTVQQLAKLINQPADVAANALSSSLILGASQAGSLRINQVLEAYPLPSIPVNMAAVGSLLRSLRQEFNLQNRLFSKLKALGGAPGQGPDLDAAARPGKVSFEQVPFAFRGRVVDQIKAGVYLPKTVAIQGKAPLVVLAPGLNTDMNGLLYVGKTLASHGYAVAALNFPFTSADTITAAIEGTGAIPPANAWYRQPTTVSALIDQVQKRW